jgi:elongation factor 1 alpha-like protein
MPRKGLSNFDDYDDGFDDDDDAFDYDYDVDIDEHGINIFPLLFFWWLMVSL